VVGPELELLVVEPNLALLQVSLFVVHPGLHARPHQVLREVTCAQPGQRSASSKAVSTKLASTLARVQHKGSEPRRCSPRLPYLAGRSCSGTRLVGKRSRRRRRRERCLEPAGGAAEGRQRQTRSVGMALPNETNVRWLTLRWKCGIKMPERERPYQQGRREAPPQVGSSSKPSRSSHSRTGLYLAGAAKTG